MKINLRILVFSLVFLAGCTQLPHEAVTLSDQVGKDISKLHAAHTQLVRQYFSSMKSNIYSFIDDTYRPYIVSETINDLNLINDLISAEKGEIEGLDPLDIMEIYSDELLTNISSFQTSMITPIEMQETNLLNELEIIYSTILYANATVTAHIRSIHKVNDAQLSILSELGLKDGWQDDIANKLAGFSEQLNEVLTNAKGVDTSLDDLPNQIENIMK